MADPVSWLLIERGWKVVARDGSELGSVHELVGDTGKDIFNGLAVSPGLLRASRYVPAERVAEIVEGCVRLDLTPHEFAHLDEQTAAPPAEVVRSDTTDISVD